MELRILGKLGKKVIHPEDVETQVFDWGTIKWTSTPKVTNAERFTFGIVILLPGKGHTKHNHPGVEEILYVVSGKGEQYVEGAEPERTEIRAGDTIHIPPDVYHETINTGWEPLVLVAVYAPPGAEEDLRKIADKVLPPGKNPEISGI